MHLSRNLVEFGHYSSKFNYFYCATPKVACTSLIMTLQKIELGDVHFKQKADGLVHERSLSPLKSPSHNDLVRSHFKFCFVRNPYDRLLSCYLDKVYNEASLESRFQAALNKTGGVSFREFIDVLCDEPEDQMEPHYAPQAAITCQDLVAYDFIGRFETLASDMNKLSDRIGVDVTKYEARIDTHKTGAKPYAWLEPDLVEKIKLKFEVDFDLFRYSAAVPAD